MYEEPWRQVRRALAREAAGHTRQPTALVHRAYLRLVDPGAVRWESRARIFGVAARCCMRQVLRGAARTRQAAGGGGGAGLVALADDDLAGSMPAGSDHDGVDVLRLDAAIEQLAALEPAQARLVELRSLAGLTIDETAAALGVSPATVSREWAVARRWLRRELAR